LKKKP